MICGQIESVLNHTIIEIYSDTVYDSDWLPSRSSSILLGGGGVVCCPLMLLVFCSSSFDPVPLPYLPRCLRAHIPKQRVLRKTKRMQKRN